MKNRFLFISLLLLITFVQNSVFASPLSLEGTFTVQYEIATDNYTITVTPTGGGDKVVFICDDDATLNNWVHRFNYGYGDDFAAAASVGHNYVEMEYDVYGGENLIVNTPVFSEP